MKNLVYYALNIIRCNVPTKYTIDEDSIIFQEDKLNAPGGFFL